MTPSAKAAGGRRRRTRWTRESVIEKILEWNALYGEPPTAADWNPSLARWRAQEWRIERYQSGDWPAVNAAKRPFGGSFRTAVREAGLVPHGPGPRPGSSSGPRRSLVTVEGDAEVRVRAALDQADAARRDAEHARAQAQAALAELDRLRADTAGSLPTARLAALRGEGPTGPAVMAAALRQLATARARGDRGALNRALIAVATAAVRWSDTL